MVSNSNPISLINLLSTRRAKWYNFCKSQFPHQTAERGDYLCSSSQLQNSVFHQLRVTQKINGNGPLKQVFQRKVKHTNFQKDETWLQIMKRRRWEEREMERPGYLIQSIEQFTKNCQPPRSNKTDFTGKWFPNLCALSSAKLPPWLFSYILKNRVNSILWAYEDNDT